MTGRLINVRVGYVPPAPVGQPFGVWTPVWGDEFNSLDLTRWQTKYPGWPMFTSQVPGGDRTNTGDASYMADSHVSVANSICTLTSTNTTTVTGLPYTSGCIVSMPDSGGGWQGTYGYFEARIRIPTMYTALWPAFWLSSSAYNTWPPEIDIFEVYGSAADYRTNVFRTSSTADYAGTVTGTDLTAWHVYGCQWTATGVTFYRDGVQVGTTTYTPTGAQYILFDLAALASQGPSWQSATMLIDYVRVWQ